MNRWTSVIAALATATIGLVVAVGLWAPATAERLQTEEWGQSLAELAAAAACCVAARHTRGRGRLIWGLFAAGQLVWTLTDGGFGLAVMRGVDVPEVSPFDAGWLAFYLPMLTGVVLLYRRLRPERGWQGVLDGLIATLAVATGGWVVAVGPIARDGSGGLAGTLVGALYPALDLTCLAALGWIVVRQGPRTPPWLRWVVAAFAIQAFAGVAYVVSALHGHDAALASAAVYMVAGWTWVIAAVARLRAGKRPWTAGAHDSPPAWSDTVPFVLGAAVIALGALRTDRELGVAATVAGALMAMRAIDTLRVNRGLLAERDRLLVTDPLTGAFNRRFLDREAVRAFARASRQDEPLSAIALDLDGFKEVNDRFGHGIGDRLLTAVSEEITLGLRVGDLLCRAGGDEFIVLCPDADETRAAEIAERLRLRIAARAARVVPELTVTASLGVARLTDDDTRPDDLLARADVALYAAKRSGRDRVARFGAAGAERPLAAPLVG
jgi:two-component system, cell cycle response regulator